MMDPDKVSVTQNVEGCHHKIVGGNIIHGDAYITVQGDSLGGVGALGKETNINTESAPSTSSGILDPDVEKILVKLNLTTLSSVFVDEELTMADLTKFNEDHLKQIGIQKMKDRIAILEEVKTWDLWNTDISPVKGVQVMATVMANVLKQLGSKKDNRNDPEAMTLRDELVEIIRN